MRGTNFMLSNSKNDPAHAHRRSSDALIGLRLLNNRSFRSASGSMFLMNRVSFGG